MLNQRMRKLELTRLEVCDIQRALGALVRNCDLNTKNRTYWERLWKKVIAQLEAQDLKEEEQ